MTDAQLIYANWVMAVATIVAASAAIASAYYARRAISEQQKMFDKQLREYRLSLSADTVLKFEGKFNDAQFRQIRSKAAQALLVGQDVREAEDVFDFFDTVGLFVRLGALSPEVTYAVFFHWINLYWRAGKHHIGAEQKDTAACWTNFEFLFNCACEIEKRKHVDSEDLRMPSSRLRQQLEDEVDVRPRSPLFA